MTPKKIPVSQDVLRARLRLQTGFGHPARSRMIHPGQDGAPPPGVAQADRARH
jgi:hypothetical protein